MPAQWNEERWEQLSDGSFRRRMQPPFDEPTEYEQMTKDELVAELAIRGLPKTGNKPELVARLKEFDEL